MYPEHLLQQATDALALCQKYGVILTTAESCTGGLLAGLITSIAGASKCFESGVVTYSNASKTALLDVDAALIEQHGAVSEEVARAMALGALSKTNATLAISITGIAGPDGGTPEKPLGLVYIALATKAHINCTKNIFKGDRQAVRLSAVEQAIAMVGRELGGGIS